MIPGWAEHLSDGGPAELVARVVRLAASGATPERQQRVTARLLDQPAVDADRVIAELERQVDLAPSAEVSAAAQQLLAAGARVAVVGGASYPRRLLQAWPDLGAPLWVFLRGAPVPDRPTAAIVGTRQPTLDGARTARALAERIAAAGGLVVSGMARGIDQAAHVGALLRGRTTAVLGAGFGVDYPRRDGGLREEIAASGGLVTEYLPDVGPRPHNFLARNRIVAGMADVTVVVEGRAGSGSQHTARLAAAQGRDVLAVPGPLFAPTSRAPLDLVRDGATVVTRPDDVLDALGLTCQKMPSTRRETGTVSPLAQAILPLLGAVPATAGTLAATMGAPVAQVLAAATELTAAGLADRSARGYTAAHRA